MIFSILEILIVILPLLGSIAFMTLAERKIMGSFKIILVYFVCRSHHVYRHGRPKGNYKNFDRRLSKSQSSCDSFIKIKTINNGQLMLLYKNMNIKNLRFFFF